jgi:hypothetical protein
MSSLTELFSPSFFFFIGILLLAIALLSFYYESKFKEQNHKLSSMLNIVSSLAEEIHIIKTHNIIMGGGVQNITPFNKTLDINSVNIDKHELIEVSDDESEDSDSEDSASDNDSEDSEEEDADDIHVVDLDKDINNVIDLDNERVKTIVSKLKGNDDHYDDTEDEDDDDDDDELQSVSSKNSGPVTLEINSTLNYYEIVAETLNEVTDQIVEEPILEENLELFNDIKKINIHDLEDTKSVNAIETNDYKKMSVNKLKNLVIERKLVADASKLKKLDLLKLLGEE